MDKFKTVKCRQCGKDFEAKIETFIRYDKPVERHKYWCSSKCYRDYYRKVTAK